MRFIFELLIFNQSWFMLLSNSYDVNWRSGQVRDGPLENLWGGGRAKYKKKNSRKGKLNEKNSCTPINPKKYSCYGLKKIHTRNLLTKKNSCGSRIPLPPHNFSNGPSLTETRWDGGGLGNTSNTMITISRHASNESGDLESSTVLRVTCIR